VIRHLFTVRRTLRSTAQLALNPALASAPTYVFPRVLTILVGHYVVGLPPRFFSIGAPVDALRPSRRSRKAADSNVPTFGYGTACAVGNVMMAMRGTLLVLKRGG
jgi:hypothetical protein